MRSAESIQAELDDQYGELFSFALRVVVENRTHADRWRDKENETGVVLYHFAKAVNLLDATRRLCHDGFAREAISTSRSLFNLVVNLRWLTKPEVSSQRLRSCLKTPDGFRAAASTAAGVGQNHPYVVNMGGFARLVRRAFARARSTPGISRQLLNRFTDYEITSKANNAMTLIKWDKNITEEQKRQQCALVRKIRPIAKELGINEGRNGMYPKWHHRIQDMAKDVDLLRDYHLTYKRLSQTEHTDPESVREYLKDDDGEVLMHGDVGPSTEYAPLVMIDSIRYFLNVKHDAALLLGFEESQEELEEYVRLKEKYADSLATC